MVLVKEDGCSANVMLFATLLDRLLCLLLDQRLFLKQMVCMRHVAGRGRIAASAYAAASSRFYHLCS